MVGKYNGEYVLAKNVLHADGIVRDSIYEYDLVNAKWTAVYKEKGTIQLDDRLWDSVVGQTGFDNQGFDNSGFDNDPVHEFSENGLYFVTLNAYNRACSRSTTQSVGIAVSSTTEVENGTSVSIQPNPSTDFFQIDLQSSQQQTAQVRLTDLSGKILLQQELTNSKTQQLDVSNFAAGIYFVQVVGANWQMVEKLMIVK